MKIIYEEADVYQEKCGHDKSIIISVIKKLIVIEAWQFFSLYAILYHFFKNGHMMNYIHLITILCTVQSILSESGCS